MSDAGEPDFAAIFKRVQENRDRLDACPRHEFSAEVPGIEGGVGAMFGRKIECKRCKGLMELVALNFYVRGYEAAGGNGNDVLPGWRVEDERQQEPRRTYFGREGEA